MQIFSSMRRDSTNLLTLKNFFLVGALVLYQIGTSLYPLLSPLLGFFFCYGVLLKEREYKTLQTYDTERSFILGYIVVIELNKGFYLFSTLVFFIFFYAMVVDWMKSAFKCRSCILVAFVVSGYLGVYAVNNLLAYIVSQPFYRLEWEYGLYILIDALLAIVFFRDRIL